MEKRTKRALSSDKKFKAMGAGERTSNKVSSIRKADGSTFKRRNANQYVDAGHAGGNDYTEKRANRTDKFDLGGTADSSENGVMIGGTMASSMYAKGGAMTKKLGLGGRVTNIEDAIATSDLKDELRSKMKKGDDVIHFAFTDYGGDFMDKVAIEYFEENYPKNTLSETTAYYGKNAFVFGKPATEWIESTKDYPLGFEDFESFYYEKELEQQNKDFEAFLDDLKRDGYEVSDNALEWLNENKSGYYSMTTQGLDFSYSDLEDELKEEGLISKEKYANGGGVGEKYYTTYANVKGRGFVLYSHDESGDNEIFIGEYKTLDEANKVAKKMGLEKRPIWARYENGGSTKGFEYSIGGL